MSNILEEYLVKIGATADMGSFNRAEGAIKGLTGSLEKLTFLLKAGGLVGAFAGVTKAIKDQIVAVADLDMEYTKLASTMWTTKESGKALAELPKLMKAKPEDIAWIPELREQFMRLRGEMSELATPSDAADQLRWIREIGYEVQSLQLKFMMFREWVVYYLIKYLGPYIEKIQEFFKFLNKTLGGNMSSWANKVAYAIKKIVDVMVSVFRLGKNIYDVADRFFTNLPQKVKALVPLFAVVGAALMASPFGLFLAAIGGALILLEDFFGYIDGRESSKTLAPMWEMLLKLMNSEKTNNFVDFLNDSLTTTLEILAEIVEGLKLPEFFDQAIESVGALADGLLEVASALANIFSLVRVNKNDFLGMFKKLGEVIMFPWRMMLRWVKLLGTWFQAMGKALAGDYEGAGKTIAGGAGDFSSSLKKDFNNMLGNNTNRTRGSNFEPNEIAQQAAIEARRVGQMKGVDPAIIYAQWSHESAGFTSQLARENLNLGGLTQTSPNGEDNKQPDGTGYYKEYSSVREYADDYMHSFLDLYPELDASKESGHVISDPEEWAGLLKREGYYGDSVGNYTNGIYAHMDELSEMEGNLQAKASMDGFYLPPEPTPTLTPTPHEPQELGLWDKLKGMFSTDSYAAQGAQRTAYAPSIGGGFAGGMNDNSSNYNIQNCTIVTQATDAAGLRDDMVKTFRNFNRGNSQGAVVV